MLLPVCGCWPWLFGVLFGGVPWFPWGVRFSPCWPVFGFWVLLGWGCCCCCPSGLLPLWALFPDWGVWLPGCGFAGCCCGLPFGWPPPGLALGCCWPAFGCCWPELFPWPCC